MEPEKDTDFLKNIPANRKHIDELYSRGKITAEARIHALQILFPYRQWQLWVSRLLLIIGLTLILSGIAYFFAFNWADISSDLKLYSIQLSILGCLIGGYFYGFKSTSGKIFLFCASILIGVFCAVFGQTYHTASVDFHFFRSWALLILPWTLLSRSAAQWVLFYILAHLSFFGWCDLYSYLDASEDLFCAYLILINLAVVFLREYLVRYPRYSWLKSQWMRIFFILSTLAMLFSSSVCYILKMKDVTVLFNINGLVGFLGHGILYFIYRYKFRSFWGLSLTLLSFCVLFEFFIFIKLTDDYFTWSESRTYFLAGIVTLIIFSLASIHLQKIARRKDF